MRKVLFVLVMLLTVGILYAATSVQIPNDDDETTATLTVSLPLKTGSGYDSNVEVGFSSSAVESFDATPGAFDGDKKVLTVDGDHADGSVYAYWKIASNDGVTINLYLDSALTGTTPENTINWTVKAIDVKQTPVAGSLTESAYGPTNDIELYKLENAEHATMNTVVGDTELEITTASFNGKAVDDYSANIVLSVEVK